MNKNKENIVPELRFPEYRSADSWKVDKLGEISEIVRGGSPRPIQEFLTSKSDGLNWLKIADVSIESKYIESTKEKVIKEAINFTREVIPGDLILSNSMSFGRPYILKIKTCIHDGWIAIRKISSDTFENYLYYFISSDFSQKYFLINAAGAAVKNLNAEIIKDLPVFIPKDKSEQQKIADCLSSLDELITAQNNKLDLLKLHKKGLMQNLFPAEGETKPKLRFKDFEKDGDWKVMILEDVSTKISDGIHTTPRYDENGNYYFINGNNLVNDSILIDEKTKKVSENEYLKHKKDLNHNTILLSINGTIGNLSIYNEEKVILGKSACYINIDDKIVNKYFILNFLKTERVLKYFNFELTGSTIKNLSLKSIKSTLINIPKNIKEQQKIADCLTAIDNSIEAESNRLEELKNHKKGLMQKLFPRVN